MLPLPCAAKQIRRFVIHRPAQHKPHILARANTCAQLEPPAALLSRRGAQHMPTHMRAHAHAATQNTHAGNNTRCMQCGKTRACGPKLVFIQIAGTSCRFEFEKHYLSPALFPAATGSCLPGSLPGNPIRLTLVIT